MVKTYLKYYLSDVLGQITGSKAIPVIDSKNSILYTAANDFILKINLKTGLIEKSFQCLELKIEVTCLCLSNDNESLAVGYLNGVITLVNLKTFVAEKKFFLHKSEITTLKFFNNSMIASGSKDCNIFIWDTIGESVLYKLIGHKGSIIKIDFASLKQNEFDVIDVVISVGKDNLMKLWNIRTQECIQSVSDLIHKISSMFVYKNIIFIGSFDDKLRIYQMHEKLTEAEKAPKYVSLKGLMTRKSKSKIRDFALCGDGKILAILSDDSSIEFIKILTEKEIKKRLIKIETDKLVKREKLLNTDDKIKEIKEKVKNLLEKGDYNYKMRFYSLFNFLNENKLKSVFFMNRKNGSDRWDYGVSLDNNSIEVYTIRSKKLNDELFDEDLIFDEENLNVDKNFTIDNYGHRDILRFVKFGDTDQVFMTASNDSVKFWNFASRNQSKTLFLENIISGFYLFNDRYAVLASRKGQIYIYDTNSLELVKAEENAHEGEIWNICKLSFDSKQNELTIISGSTDKKIKYWKITCSSDQQYFKKFSNIQITDLTFVKEFETQEQITYCLVSPNEKFLTYALVDNSIRILFEDTQKNFLPLYGHKLPVLGYDISSDENLLVSGSADKNIKIWGLDHGDCHKSFFAHQDSVTAVKFVKKTHYFFSASKDKSIKYWDADTFDLILEFNDSFNAIWSIDINSHGTVLLSASADRSIKVYELTKEAVLVDYENEKKLENNIEKELEKELESNTNLTNKSIENTAPLKKTIENLTYAEDLMESLDTAEKFRKEVYQYEIALEEYKENTDKLKNNKKNLKNVKLYNLEIPDVPVESPHLLGKNIFDFIIEKLKQIRYSELENTLNNLPFSYVQVLLFYLEYYVRNNIEIELCSRCVNFIFILFESQISNDKTILRFIDSIQANLKKNLKVMKEALSFNIQAINLLIREHKFTKQSIEEFKSEVNQKNSII